MWRFALKELTRRKSRSLLAFLGIAACTALLSSVLCLSHALQNAARQPFQTANADLVVQRELAECPFALVKHAGRLGGIPERLVEQIRGWQEIEVATGVLELWAISGKNEKDRTVVTGIEPAYQKQIGPLMQQGRCCTLTDHHQGGRYLRFNDTHSCLVEKPYADRHGLKRGDTISLGGTNFEVVGTVEASPGARISAGEVYIPLKEAQTLLGEGEVVNAIFVRARNPQVIPIIEKRLREFIKVDTRRGDKLVITSEVNVMNEVAGMAILAQSAIRWVAASVVLAVLLLLLKSALSSVTERMREIGTMKAVGWQDRHVAKLLSLEWALLSIVGGLVGTGLGSGAAYAYTAGTRLRLPTLLNNYPACAKTPAPVDIKFSLEGCELLIVGAFLIAVSLGILTGYLAARRAAQVPPAEALRTL